MAILLKNGFTFNFRNKTWKVTETYTIKWDDGTKSSEFKVKSNTGDINFLEIEKEQNGKTHYSFWQKERGNKIAISTPKNESVEQISVARLKFPSKILFDGIQYNFQKRYDGRFSDGYETETVNSLDYVNNDESKLLSIEVWEDETEFSTGFWLNEKEITNVKEGKASVDSSFLVKNIKKYLFFFLFGGFFLLSLLLNKCSNSLSSANDDSSYNSDSTQVHRSNNAYRSRNSRGYGK